MDIGRLEGALIAAHEAGDTEAARMLAGEIKGLRTKGNASVASEVGQVDASLIAAGRTFSKIGQGVKQLTLGAAEKFGPKFVADAARSELGSQAVEEREKDAAYSELSSQRPYSTGIGEFLPYAAAPGGILASSALTGGMEALKYGSANERANRGLLGAATTAAGGLLGKVAGAAIAPVRKGAVSETQRAALSSMNDIGVTPRLSQVTGSPFMSRVEDWAARTPGGIGTMREFAEKNTRAVNRTAAQGIGESADELTPAVFAAANQRMGQVFEAIKTLGGRPIEINARVGSAADEILRQQAKMIPAQQDAALTQLANQARALAANSGRIDGETYQLIRSGLSESAFDASGTNRMLYGKLLQALDDSADASLRASGQTALADALKTVRPQYANLKLLEKGAVAEAGNVSPAKLASVLRTQNPAAFREGRMQGNPLYEIAKQGEAFKPLQQGSQTYERTLLSNPLATAVGAGPAWLASKAATSPMLQAYPRYFGGTPTAGLLAQGMQPAVRGASMGLLQHPLAGLLPVMAE
jgi:hypothetical protein